jgi:hypothetical protein
MGEMDKFALVGVNGALKLDCSKSPDPHHCLPFPDIWKAALGTHMSGSSHNAGGSNAMDNSFIQVVRMLVGGRLSFNASTFVDTDIHDHRSWFHGTHHLPGNDDRRSFSGGKDCAYQYVSISADSGNGEWIGHHGGETGYMIQDFLQRTKV